MSAVAIVLAGGGTAGHTSPLIATAEALRARAEVDLVCVGTPKGLESRVIPEAGLRLELIDPVPMPRRLTPELFAVPVRLWRAVGQARRILIAHKAQVAVGFGGDEEEQPEPSSSGRICPLTAGAGASRMVAHHSGDSR